jgi:hypothetical protein
MTSSRDERNEMRDSDRPGLIYGSDGSIIGEKSMSDAEFLAPLLSSSESDFPVGSQVTQPGYAGVFTVTGFWRGYAVLRHVLGTTHKAPLSELTIEPDPESFDGGDGVVDSLFYVEVNTGRGWRKVRGAEGGPWSTFGRADRLAKARERLGRRSSSSEG